MEKLNDLLAAIIGRINQIDSKDTSVLTSAKSYADTQVRLLSAKIPDNVLNWCGEWDEYRGYAHNDAVYYNGSSYYAVSAGSAIPDGISPDDDPDSWKVLAAKGKDGTDGYTPVKGRDYFTTAEKTEMINAVIAALPVYDGSVI